MTVGTVLSVTLSFLIATQANAQNRPSSNTQALALAAQSIAAMTSKQALRDVTLTATGTWNGPDSGSATATLQALGTAESRMDLALADGTRTEIRDAQSGAALGEWINPDGTSGLVAPQNCSTDAVWFFPVLGSLAAGQNVVLSYIGQETRNGESVQHLHSYIYQATSNTGINSDYQTLSAMDFYLDSVTLLPVAITFNAYPDNSTSTTIQTEADFSDYQNLGGFLVPMHIEKYSQGNLLLDLNVSSAVFNSGLTLSTFTLTLPDAK